MLVDQQVASPVAAAFAPYALKVVEAAYHALTLS